MSKFLTGIFDFLSSVKLAVIIILAMAVLFAIGTFYEAEHGTPEAQRVIYKSWYAASLMFLLIINLSAAAIDRMPWKKNHVGFVITHAGIIVLIVGSFITQKKGLDGTLAIGPNETSDYFIVAENELHVYQNLDGRPFAILLQQAVDFDSDPPSKKTYEFGLVDDDKIKVISYLPKAVRKVEMTATEDVKAPPAVKFFLHNPNVQVEEWLGLDGKIPAFYNLGPALVTFVKGNVLKPAQPSNQIVIAHDQKGLDVGIYSARKTEPTLRVRPVMGKEYETGWMNLKFQIKDFVSHAKPKVLYLPAKEEDQVTTQAVEVEIAGKRQWFEVGNPGEMKGAQNTYFVYFANRRFNLGFKVTLLNFKVGMYPGSAMPMSYESRVKINGMTDHTISMNEPLTQSGFTLYQSSYETNERGEPVLSVFSVNYDPGRQIKYLGSLMIVLGIAIMFYWKPRYSRKKREA